MELSLHVLSLQSCSTLAAPGTVAHQAPLSMIFPMRQEYWSGLPFASPGDLPNPGIRPVSVPSPELAVVSLPLSHQGRP